MVEGWSERLLAGFISGGDGDKAKSTKQPSDDGLDQDDGSGLLHLQNVSWRKWRRNLPSPQSANPCAPVLKTSSSFCETVLAEALPFSWPFIKTFTVPDESLPYVSTLALNITVPDAIMQEL